MWVELARLFDSQPVLNWAPGIAFLFLATYMTFRLVPAPAIATEGFWTRPLFFFIVVALSLVALRLPSFLFLGELDVDESQLITNARKFLVNAIPWLSVDTTTSGPLNSYVLALPSLFGIPIHYPSTRITGVLLLLCTLIFSHLTIRTLCGETAARIAVLPTVALLGLGQRYFLDFSTELLPITLLAGATYLFGRAARGTAGPGSIYAAGLCLGAVPFAKLQGAPLAALAFVFAFFSLRSLAAGDATRSNVKKRRVDNLLGLRLWLIAGASTVPVIISGMVLAGGAASDAWRSYIVMNASLSSRPFTGKFLPLFLMPPFFAYICAMVVFALAPSVLQRAFKTSPTRTNDAWIIASSIYALAAVYVIYKGGNPYSHYLLFLLHPLMLLTGLLWHRALAGGVPALISRYQTSLVMIACMLFVVWALLLLRTWSPVHGKLTKWMEAPIDLVPQLVLELAGKDRHFAVWGYEPRYYVQSGLHPSTRDAMTQFQIHENPLKDYYVERYLRDFRAAQPNVFVEATGDGNFNKYWNADPSYSAVPELARIINQDFALVHDIPRCGKTPQTRIFVRKDRVRELGIALAPPQAEICDRQTIKRLRQAPPF